RIDNHGTEFKNVEVFAFTACSQPTIQHWSGRSHLDQSRDNGNNRRKQYNRSDREKNVETALGNRVHHFFGSLSSTAMIQPYFPMNRFDRSTRSIALKIGNRTGNTNVLRSGTNASAVR